MDSFSRKNNAEYEEKVRSLHKGAALIGQAKNTDELYDAISITLRDSLKYPTSGIAIPDNDYMHFVRTADLSHGASFSLPLNAPSLSNRAYREKKTQMVNDIRSDPDFFAGPPGSESGPISLSNLVVPVIISDNVRLILNLESKELNGFSRLDVEILEILGMHVSSAISRLDQLKALVESEARIQAIMDQAADSIVLMDVKDKIIFWNPAAERLFGFTFSEAVGETFEGLLVPEGYKEKYIENRACARVDLYARTAK